MPMKLRVLLALIFLAFVALAISPAAATSISSSIVVSGCARIPPVVSFSFPPSSGAAPLSVTFSSVSSKGVITSYAWAFGDGGTSAIANPTHVYTTPGTYNPSLTLYGPCDAQASLTSTTPVTVTPSLPPPQAAFTYSQPCGVLPLTVQFTDTSTGETSGSTITYAWNFGDPSSGTSNTATVKNPTHKYTKAGSYPVTFTVTVTTGSYSASSTTSQTITVIASTTPCAKLSAKPTSGNIPLSVVFTDSSTGNCFTTWTLWFDSTHSTTTQTQTRTYPYTYSAVGTYKATLTLGNPSSSKTSSASVTITATCPTITAAFSVSPTSAKVNQLVTVKDTSSKATGSSFTSWTLDFGDKTTIVQTNPSPASYTHTYITKGSYTITLTVTNSCSKSVKTLSNFKVS